MTAAAESVPVPTDALAGSARTLAESQGELCRSRPRRGRLREASLTTLALEHARAQLAASHAGDVAMPKAAEWFLDNYYLIRRVARQVDDELPPGFVRHLPQLASGPASGQLRIEVMAEALVATSQLELDASAVRRFVDAYQQVSALTIAELWALPTLLRTSVLSHLLRFLARLIAFPAGMEQRAALELDTGIGVERATRALRLLDAIDWKALFEGTNRIEAILRRDPAAVYPRMDFATCDAYRKVVEAIAWAAGTSEPDVAEAAIALAREHPPAERGGHVGYFLVGDGRGTLEARVGFRATGLERVRRAMLRRPTLAYLLSLSVLTALPLVALGGYLAWRAAHPLTIAVALLVAVIPVSILAVAAVQRAVAALIPPRTLPKLDFARGIPSEARTLVVIPTLLARVEDVDRLVRQLELHYLGNPDPALRFAVLADDVDAETMPENAALLARAEAGIAALNTKHGHAGAGPFHLLHRESRWNAAERRFMGWERKRGKLDELNRLLRGDTGTSYTRHVGDAAALEGIRFVITLDTDTQLPMGTAHRLVGLLAHPLNRAVVDHATGRVIAGYTVVQPRVETTPSSARRTWFSRIFAGDAGFDIYTHAVSELYQDLFGSGIYVGKGIYDVDAFMRSVEARAPENALVSHDLFEGVHGRTALATDIVLFEEYPASYVAFTKRMHRWVRGDWQLLPWLLPFVPSTQRARIRNKLSSIDRWKIVDNLRRSLTSPLLVVLLVLGWVWLPANPFVWTAASLALLLAPVLPALADRRQRVPSLARFGLAVAFLAFEAILVVDAIVRVLVRMAITRRRMLEWTSAAHAMFGLEARSLRAVCWRAMWASPAVSVAIAGLVAWLRPGSLPAAAPLLAIWAIAPEIARWVSGPMRARTEALRREDRAKLRLLARRTWRFFDAFVGPNDQWLPIDNYQAEPHEQTAHRTSPTNIGLMLLATLSAYDFGYLGPSELSLRVRRAFDSIARLPHYQGHLFNWYTTTNLEPLLPRYVSTVDSGNLAGCLVALAQGCRELAAAPVVRVASWDGLADSLALLDEVVAEAPSTGTLRAVLARMQDAVAAARTDLGAAHARLAALHATSTELDRELLAFLGTGAQRHEVDLLRALRAGIDSVHHQLQSMQRELANLLPWLALADEPAARALALPANAQLDEIPALAKRLRGELAAWTGEQAARDELAPALEASAARVGEALEQAERHATALAGELHALAAFADREVAGMDFRLLFDRERKLFHIGHNVTLDRIDPHYYDLLASEARLASYLAIVKRDVPEAHWYALGRPMTNVAGAPGLLSWGGTMFEYLMPGLLMRSHEGTLLARTCELAVATQIAAARPGEPWGVSESGFARMDANHTYQYRSFGVPGLGFKRGLEDDHVVAPYASLLAVALRPRAVVDNVARLEALGMLGPYGLFEALDLTAERAPDGRSYAVVRSYMAHHQGMLLVALGNVLTERTMVDRFHADARVETGALLLDEHAPAAAPPEWLTTAGGPVLEPSLDPNLPHAPGAWTALHAAGRQAFVLGNGRLSSLVTDTGGGGLRWHGLALTRYEADATCDDDGLWIYIRDDDTGQIWLATSAEGRTTYAMHEVELHRRNDGLSVHVQVAVAPADDVEVRHVTVHNESGRPRRISVTTAGRPVLFPVRQAPTHPAFSSLFVDSERLVELDAVVFARRPQSTTDEPAVLVHRLVSEDPAVTAAGYETDRAAFYGRPGSFAAPAALVAGRGALRGRSGAVLDPVMSVMASVALKPQRSASLAFVTTVARARSAAIDLARRYGSMHAVRWAMRDAEQESPRRLARSRVDPALVPSIQRLFSALLFADPTLRSASEVAAARPSKPQLWGRGISGDDPIVFVRVADAEAPLLAETLAAQRYLRSCGVRLDLVLLDEQATGYASEGSGSLRSVLGRHDTHDWIGRHGGIFVLAADQILADERRRLEASARVVLDTRDGTLASAAGRIARDPPMLPRFEPTLVEHVTPRPRPRPALVFDNGTGGFTPDGREYVIQVTPERATPAPWCNVLANPDFGCLVSESSLGLTWSLNSGENRLTPWRNDPVLDPPAEALYVRDEETAAVWSPTPLPAGRDVETTVRHGAGYTVYETDHHGLAQTLTVFVPPDAPLKVVRLQLANTLARRRRLTVTYYAEWVLGTRREEHRPYIVCEHDRSSASLLATCSWNAELGERVAFLASRHEVHGFTTDRTEFLGRRGDHARPEALERWGLSGSVVPGVDPCAALQIHLELAPGEAVDTHFVLGQARTRDEALALVARYRSRDTVDAAWTALQTFWDGILDTVRVATPEPAMNLLLGRWLLYQSLSARVFGRTGFYQSSGAFGFRDQLQDVLALLHAAPQRARAQILSAAAHQFEAGDVLHWWHPPSGRGVRTRCSDDLVWLPYVTAEYVAATGDVAILDEPVPFLAGEPLRPGEHDRYAQYLTANQPAPLLEHCRRALERGATAGPHGLPLFGDGDWNDGMNRIGAQGRGESIWLGWFLCATMNRFATLSETVDDSAAASAWRARADALRANIEACAWDGGWYLRAFHDDGSLVGSASSRECRIDSIAQSWAVLSRRRDTSASANAGTELGDARARAAVRAADAELVREADRLVLLFWPPYDSTLHDPGYVRAYPPGIRENGGQYTHAATWLGWAHAALGDGDRAERIFRLLNPILRARTADEVERYRVEPYALAADIYSCPPSVGRGGWTWYTGAAAWLWRLGVEAILGLRREANALCIEPCIPAAWDGFEAWVRIGRQQVHVVVSNPHHVATGASPPPPPMLTLTLDGTLLAGNRVVLDPDVAGNHEVRVRLGAHPAAAMPHADPHRAVP